MSAYRMIRPCPKCPFRNDLEPYIKGDRAEEIADGLRRGGEFTCHETTVHVEDDMVPGPNAAHCAGALIVLEKAGEANQMMRIAERLGMYDAAALDMAAPVFDDLDEWVDAVYDGPFG